MDRLVVLRQEAQVGLDHILRRVVLPEPPARQFAKHHT